MPEIELMTWAPKQRRWLKKYRGKMYSVSARQLERSPTKAASRKAANEWWIAKQKELDAAAAKPPEHPPEVIEEYKQASHNHRIYAKCERRLGRGPLCRGQGAGSVVSG